MDVKICFLHRNTISFLAEKAKIPNFVVAFMSAGPVNESCESGHKLISIMKNHVISAALVATLLGIATLAQAQTPKKVKYTFTEASDLTLIGKLFPDTPNPYHRIDTVKHKGFTKYENLQVRQSSGIAVVFNTNSTTISVKTEFGYLDNKTNTGDYSSHGYDLYIKKDGKWLWAAAGCAPIGKEEGYNHVLIKNMNADEKECLLYIPLFSEENSIKIGVQEGATMTKGEAPFRHRVGIFGSSYTHGTSTSRPGMTYPAQFTRMTGIQLLSIACSGNCKLQSYFADALVDADAEAFIFDAFSNPTPEMIKERLFPFIEKLNAAHPGKPLIFQHTIYREKRNFDLSNDKAEQAKMDMADSLMKIAVKKYPDVYYVTTTNATDPAHDSSVDGVHPDDHGYTLWAESIRKPILKILKKYGIK